MHVRMETTRTTGSNALFLMLVLATIGCWWHWLIALLRLAYSNEQYSHVLLVLPVSVSLALLEVRWKGIRPRFAPLPGLALTAAGLVLWAAGQMQIERARESALLVSITGLVACWIGLVMLLYGTYAVRQLLFPLLFLFLIVPIPQLLVDKCISALQIASSDVTYWLFRWTGVPVLKHGLILSLPTLEIEIAKQCSGIRSALMLFLSTLILGHLYLRSHWTRALFVLATIPFAIAKNAIRIFTLSMLAMNVDRSFLEGRLHHNGGIVFFILTFAGMVILLKGLQKAEQRTREHTLPQSVQDSFSVTSRVDVAEPLQRGMQRTEGIREGR